MRRVWALLGAVVITATACSSSRPAPSLAWQVSRAFGPGAVITSVMADPWVAVGSVTGPDGQPATGCYRAPDGLGWTPCALEPIDTDGRHTRLLSVARVGDKIVAGGVAVGALHGNLRPYLWAGPVTVAGSLGELNLPRELFGGQRIITFGGLSAGPGGAFAAGTWDGVTNRSVAQVWRSGDGTDWQRLDGVASLTSGPEEILRGQAVAAGAGGVILVGAVINLRRLADRDDGAVWWSPDGATWQRADVAAAGMGGPGDQELRTAVAAPDGPGFTVGGADGGVAAIWSSPDGKQWRPADPMPGGRGRGATVTALVTAAGTAGRHWAAGVVNGVPKLWRSADGRRWADIPLPSVLDQNAGSAQNVTLAAGDGHLLVVVQGARGSAAARADY